MAYLRFLCLFVHSAVQHRLCCVFFCLSSSCVAYVASFSGLSMFDWLGNIDPKTGMSQTNNWM
jgi:hypothetical protein